MPKPFCRNLLRRWSNAIYERQRLPSPCGGRPIHEEDLIQSFCTFLDWASRVGCCRQVSLSRRLLPHKFSSFLSAFPFSLPLCCTILVCFSASFAQIWLLTIVLENPVSQLQFPLFISLFCWFLHKLQGLKLWRFELLLLHLPPLHQHVLQKLCRLRANFSRKC